VRIVIRGEGVCTGNAGGLLRTEGRDVVADMAAGDQAIAITAALRPHVAVVDVSRRPAMRP
jgi:hypothetical protein